MTALANPAPRSVSSTSRADKSVAVAKLMQTADDLIAIYDEFAKWPSLAGKLPEWPWNPPSVDTMRIPNREGERARNTAEATLQRLPPLADLLAMHGAMRRFTEEAADERRTRILIAVMVDRFPTANVRSPEVYVEGLVNLATRGSYSPTQVAKACDTIITTSKFLPAPAEFSRALESSRELPLSALTLDRAIETIQILESRLAEANARGPLDITEAWRSAIRQFVEYRDWYLFPWGPRPGDPGCMAPPAILAEFGLTPPATAAREG